MTNIGILTKPKLPEVKLILQELNTWLRQHQKKVILDSATAALIGEPLPYQKTDIATLSDMVLVLGGDGTMLNAARLVEERSVPILGINMGGLGFLTETTIDHLYPSLEQVFAGDFHLDQRLMLRTRIHRHGEQITQATVLNDVVVSKGPLARMIKTEICINGNFVTNLRGDGLIIATATGSTAYSLSAGGPILDPSLDAVVMNPISPHTLTHRPLLVPSHASLEIILTSDERAMTTFDGQVGVEMSSGDAVTVSASTQRTQLIRFPDRTYFDVLRTKLKWGDG